MTIGDIRRVKFSLEQDLNRLAALAYHRREWSGALVSELHRLRQVAGKHPDFPLLEKVCAWLFVPFTLWPIDFHGLSELVQQRIAKKVKLESELRVLLDSLPPEPSAEVQAIAAEHEHLVQRGDYATQVKAGEKYGLNEEKLLNDQEFLESWEKVKAAFDVEKYRDEKGIIRRGIVSERAFRNEWGLNWKDPAARFTAVLDAFCHRWNLYGMAGDRPLLQKLTVNLTPHGTMIFIPSWWSFDAKRDLNWPEVKRLHNVRVASKQGPKLTRNQMEQALEAEKAAAFDVQARANGLKGEKRANWVMDQLNWVGRDPRTLRLILRRAKRLKR